MKFTKKFLLLSLAAIFMTGSALAQDNVHATIKTRLIDNNDDTIGQVKLVEGTEGVLITLIAQGLPPGMHGMHFHDVGDCSDHEHFKNAKGHIMSTGKPHGFLHVEGPHEGNLPNLIVHPDGTAHVELYSNMVQFAKGDAALLDDDGSALIIHTNEDDHITQPIGGSGARIACAVIGGQPKPPAVEPALEEPQQSEIPNLEEHSNHNDSMKKEEQ